MPPDIREQDPGVLPHPRLFGKAGIILILSLSACLILCLVLAWTTRDAMAHRAFIKSRTQTAAQNSLVDLRPWETAEDLAGMAVTAEEQQFSHEAERLADHEVDQAFASALRQAQFAAQRRALKGDALILSRKVAQLQQLVKEDQARVQSLVQSAGQNLASDDLELAKAQLGLDSDELADAQHDLARAIGDERGRLQQELAARDAATKKHDAEAAARGPVALASAHRYGTLAARLAAWFDQRTRYSLLQQAAQQIDADSASLTAQHNQTENQSSAKSDSAQDTEARLNSLKNRSLTSQLLSIYDDRIQTEQQLSSVYRKWAAQVLLQHQIVFHLIMQSAASIAFILICALFLSALIRYLLDRSGLGRRAYSYRLVSRLTIQLLTAALILVIIFGMPSEMPTIVGLTTAGLTVVLQDFIISFCGWFVLMGRNGIRVGDLVEINGVAGEVLDIGLFRTSLLETGNWTDRGHPTGRRVAFTNSFAIKGQYFNFTTSGQWMWDEISVTVPGSGDPYGTIELIHKAALEETGKESNLAEQEWKRVGHAGGMSGFSAAAAVNMRPGPAGIDVVVRYVTRASSRDQVRNHIYQRLIELLHKPALPSVPAPA